jgi:hypothetical protein
MLHRGGGIVPVQSRWRMGLDFQRVAHGHCPLWDKQRRNRFAGRVSVRVEECRPSWLAVA